VEEQSVNVLEKIALIENCMDLDEGTLKPEDDLTSYEEWDSLTALSIIAAADEKYHRTLTGEDMRKVKTVSDIVKLLG
jgi:acyl carrier protein